MLLCLFVVFIVVVRDTIQMPVPDSAASLHIQIIVKIYTIIRSSFAIVKNVWSNWGLTT